MAADAVHRRLSAALRRVHHKWRGRLLERPSGLRRPPQDLGQALLGLRNPTDRRPHADGHIDRRRQPARAAEPSARCLRRSRQRGVFGVGGVVRRNGRSGSGERQLRICCFLS